MYVLTWKTMKKAECCLSWNGFQLIFAKWMEMNDFIFSKNPYFIHMYMLTRDSLWKYIKLWTLVTTESCDRGENGRLTFRITLQWFFKLTVMKLYYFCNKNSRYKIGNKIFNLYKTSRKTFNLYYKIWLLELKFWDGRMVWNSGQKSSFPGSS